MSKLAAIAMLKVIVDTGLSPQNSVAGWTRIGIEAGKVINRDKVLVGRRVECFASTGKECKPDHPILSALQNGKDFSAKQSRKGWKSHDTEVEMTLANAMPKGPEEEVLARQVGDLERTLKARAKLALNVGPGALDVYVLPESGSASATAPLTDGALAATGDSVKPEEEEDAEEEGDEEEEAPQKPPARSFSKAELGQGNSKGGTAQHIKNRSYVLHRLAATFGLPPGMSAGEYSCFVGWFAASLG
jgi:hypothetical protein